MTTLRNSLSRMLSALFINFDPGLGLKFDGFTPDRSRYRNTGAAQIKRASRKKRNRR